MQLSIWQSWFCSKDAPASVKQYIEVIMILRTEKKIGYSKNLELVPSLF